MIIDRRTGFVKGKYLHQQGIVTKAQYVPFSQNVEARGYTGLFQSGAQDVIIRFSEAGQHLDGITPSVNPSIALKFLRSGITSGNQFGMVAFETEQEGQWNFWENDFQTNLQSFSESDSKENVCIATDGSEIFDPSKVV